MRRSRTSFVLFLLILALPVIALNFGGPKVTDWLAERTARFVPQTPVTTEVEPAPQDPFQWLNDRPALRDVFIPDELTQARLVTVKKIVSAEELLESGEDMPSEALLELYAAARAPAQLMSYCTEIIATIGQSCDVVHTQSRRDRMGNWVLDGQLAYLPAAPLGDPSTVENGQLLSTRALLPYSGDLAPANEAASREAMLIQAQEVCDQLRARLGNCVLSGVTFDLNELWITDLEVLPADTNPERVEATAEFSVYADQTALDETGFAELVATLINSN